VKDDKIDKELIPLVKELNRIGLKTYGCCSGHNKETAYINIDFRYIESISVRNTFNEQGEPTPYLQIEWELAPQELKK